MLEERRILLLADDLFVDPAGLFLVQDLGFGVLAGDADLEPFDFLPGLQFQEELGLGPGGGVRVVKEEAEPLDRDVIPDRDRRMRFAELDEPRPIGEKYSGVTVPRQEDRQGRQRGGHEQHVFHAFS